MLRRTGVALATVMLVLPLTVVAQKSRRSRSSSRLDSHRKAHHGNQEARRRDHGSRQFRRNQPSPDADTESVSGLSFRVRFRRSASTNRLMKSRMLDGFVGFRRLFGEESAIFYIR